ncbi:MAG: heme exporter protein CcmD [Woeseia sp.]
MELLTMGKYGVYVWTSFGLAFMVVITCVVQARRRHQAVLRDIRNRLEIMGNTE